MQQSDSFPEARYRTDRPYLAMTGLYLGTFTGMLSETSLNIALPKLMSDFRVDAALAQWMVVGYMLVIGIVLPFAGILMKRVPAKRLTVFALAAFLTGSVISCIAPNFACLLAGRMIQGIGTGIVLPLTFAIAMEVFPPHKIGAAMGLTALIIMFAPVIGPTYSGLAIGFLSWRFIFLTFAAILAVALFFAARFMVNPYQVSRQPIDIPSCALSVIGFAGIVLGSCLSSSYGWVSTPVIATLLIGIVALIAYARRQLASESPLLNLSTFKNPNYAKGTILVMVNFGITLASMYVLPQYLQAGRELPVAQAGLLMLPGGVVNALVSYFAGRLYDKYGAKTIVKIGFLCSVAGAAMLLAFSATTPLAYIISAHVVLMIGVPLAMSPAQTEALKTLPRQHTGDGSTILNTVQQVMGAVCTAVATSLLGSNDGAAAFVQGSRRAFIFTLALAVVGLLVSLVPVTTRTTAEKRT